LFERVEDYIQSCGVDDLKKLTVVNIAKELKVSRFLLSRILKRKLGTGLREYLFGIIVNKLSEWENSNSKTISMELLAEKAGYSSDKYFYKRYQSILRELNRNDFEDKSLIEEFPRKIEGIK